MDLRVQLDGHVTVGKILSPLSLKFLIYPLGYFVRFRVKIKGDNILLLIEDKKWSVKVNFSASVSSPSSNSFKASVSSHT